MAARMPSRWARAGCGRGRTNGARREREAQASQASRCAGASAGSGEVVEQPELFAQQERAVERAVGLLDLVERGELADRLAFGRLEQRPAGALDPAAGRGVASARGRSTRRGGPGRSRGPRAGPRGTGRSRSRRRERRRGWRAGTRRSCRSRPPGSSRGAARARRRTPARVALLRPGRHHTIAPVRVVGDAGQVALPAAVADLVDGGFILHLRQRVVGFGIGFGGSRRVVGGRPSRCHC